MLSLFPEFAVRTLSSHYNKLWEQFDQVAKTSLILAYTEGAVTHARLSQFCTEHPRDVSATLIKLEKSGALATTGQYRAKTYHIPGHLLPAPEDVFGSSPNSGPSSPNSGPSSPNSGPSSPNSGPSSPNLDKYGRIVHSQFSYPLIDDLSTLEPEFRKKLETLVEKPRAKQRINPEEMKAIILELCREQYVTTGALANLLNRKPETLVGQYLSRLKDENKLQMAFPRSPTHPKQAYLST